MSYLKRITFNWDRIDDKTGYPFNVPAISSLNTLNLDRNVVFIVGENVYEN